jgi:hypothetical protein
MLKAKTFTSSVASMGPANIDSIQEAVDWANKNQVVPPACTIVSIDTVEEWGSWITTVYYLDNRLTSLEGL